MNKFKRFICTTALSISILGLPIIAGAAPYTVQKGDSFYSIASKYGVSVSKLQSEIKRKSNELYAGETINVPDSTVSKEEKELLAKLVHAEAQGEPYAGKVAVATVVLNRVDHKDFPNTISGVIYETVQGHYAFSPVQDGAINQGYTAEDMKAVNEALAFRGQGNESIYFYNPKTSTSKWIFSRETTITIGNHRFAK